RRTPGACFIPGAGRQDVESPGPRWGPFIYSQWPGGGCLYGAVRLGAENRLACENTAVGASRLQQNTTGNHNVALGGYALYNNTTSQNTPLGAYALGGAMP